MGERASDRGSKAASRRRRQRSGRDCGQGCDAAWQLRWRRGCAAGAAMVSQPCWSDTVHVVDGDRAWRVDAWLTPGNHRFCWFHGPPVLHVSGGCVVRRKSKGRCSCLCRCASPPSPVKPEPPVWVVALPLSRSPPLTSHELVFKNSCSPLFHVPHADFPPPVLTPRRWRRKRSWLLLDPALYPHQANSASTVPAAGAPASRRETRGATVAASDGRKQREKSTQNKRVTLVTPVEPLPPPHPPPSRQRAGLCGACAETLL